MTVFDRVGIPRHDWGRATQWVSDMTRRGNLYQPSEQGRKGSVTGGWHGRRGTAQRRAFIVLLLGGSLRGRSCPPSARGAEPLMVAGSRPRAASEGRRTDQTMTYAPELPGADDLVRILIRNGVLRPARCWQSSFVGNWHHQPGPPPCPRHSVFCHSPPRRRRMRGSEMSAQMDAERTRP